MKTPRQIAVESLLRVDSRSAWSNRVLDSQLQKYKLDSRDAAFVSALFYGVLERRITLDACIAAHSKTRLDKLSGPVREILRTAVYQLLYMDAVPPHAAVGEAVNTAKQMGQARAGGFVNGVLRSFLRGECAVPLPEGPLELRLSVEFSCPPELVGLWLRAYGEERARAFLSATLGRPPLYLRANTLRISAGDLAARLTAVGYTAEPDPHLPGCLAVQGPGSPAALPEHSQGLFHVQDRSSQLCAAALDARPGQLVLDACAAPGGKTFTIAQHMENRGRILACDLHPHRVGKIEKRAGELGITIVETRAMDMGLPHPELGEFHRVLCDVPCSGLGVIRRKPEIKYKPLEEFRKIPSLQYKILENAANYLCIGGVLLYSTCALNPAENEEVVDAFLEAHPNFERTGPPLGLADYTIVDADHGDGFFVCPLVRKS